jgi:ubiquilin
MMQTMTNQDYRAQQQRHHDLALANIENMPGGFNMLRNLYETVQVPMEEAATDVSRGSGGNRTSNNDTATTNTTAGATNQAMPNPWGSPRPSRTSNALNSNATMTNPLLGLGGGGADPFGAGGNPFAASMGMMGPLSGGGMQQPSREQQEAAITMLESNPALQQMLSASIRQNPAMLRQMMQQSGNPAAAMMNNLSDEQLASMMEMATNPTAMRGIMRMQDMMQNSPNGGMPNPMEMMALMGGGGGGFGTNNNNNPLFGGAIPATLAHNPWAHPSSSPSSPATSSSSAPHQPPAVRYARQLEQMRNMGFDDEAAALAALERAHGNLNRAVDILLDSSSNGGAGGGGSDNTTTDT